MERHAVLLCVDFVHGTVVQKLQGLEVKYMTGVRKNAGYRTDVFSTGVRPNGQRNLTCTTSALTSPLWLILISLTPIILPLTEIYDGFLCPKVYLRSNSR